MRISEPRSERLRLAWVTVGILLALALAVGTLRFYRIAEVPPGLYYDGGANGLDALQVLKGKHAVFFPEKSNGREWLGVYLVALSTSFLGRTILAVRLPTALVGSGAVFAVFWLGWLLFCRDEESGEATPWRGLLVGASAAGLMAVSIGPTVLGRTGFRVQLLPLLLTLSLALLWWAGRRRVLCGGAWGQVILAGACTGMVAYSYTPARFVPFLLLFFGLSFLLPLGSASKLEDRIEQLKRHLPWLGAYVGVAALVAAPLMIYFVLNLDHFFMRSGQLSVFHPSRNQGDPLGTLLANLWAHLLVFGFRGDPNWRHTFASLPLLNPVEAFFFWLGAGISVWRWRRPAYRLLCIWLAVLFLPATLAVDIIPPPNTVRIIGAVPAIYLLAAVGIWESLRFVEERYRAAQGRTSPDSQEINNWTSIVLAVVIIGVLPVQGVISFRTYFKEYAAAPELFEAYNVEWTELARVLNAQPTGPDLVYLIPHPKTEQPYGFEYLYQGAAPVQYLHLTTPHNLAQKTELSLREMENVSTVKVVDWDNDRVGGDAKADQHLAVLFAKHGHYLNSDAFDSFQIHTYDRISLDRPWSLYEYLEPQTVHYDGGISLQAIALGRGSEQLSVQQTVDLGDERSLWVALQWQTAPGLESDYSISLRLHDDEGAGVYQRDGVLANSAPSSTRHWSADEPVVTLIYLDVPATIPTGEYELRLVVYDFDTLKPTVEIGVWQAETVLARLRFDGIK